MCKNKCIAFVHELFSLFLRYPVEILFGLLCYYYGCWIIHEYIFGTGDVNCGAYAERFLFALSLGNLAFALNGSHGKKGYWAYRLLPIAAFIGGTAIGIPRIAEAYVSQFATWIGISALLFWSIFASDNLRFAQRLSSKIRSMLFATLIGILSNVLYWGLVFSVRYIFDAESAPIPLEYYIANILLWIIPVFVFLWLDSRHPLQESFPRIIDAAINYVVTPALIIYSILFYLYLTRILLQWSLPKGGIAIMVLVYICMSFFFRILSELLEKRPMKWFYTYFPFISLPALPMFWWAVCYRILEYGFTVERVYLLAAGVVLTAYIVMLMLHPDAKFRWLVIMAIIALCAISYVPTFTAKDIERRSQTERFDEAVVALELLDEQGHILPEKFRAQSTRICRQNQDGTRELVNRDFVELADYIRRYYPNYVKKKYGYDFRSMEITVPEEELSIE